MLIGTLLLWLPETHFFLYYSNGAVCGALLGCKVGFSALPDDLLQLKHRQWLDDQVDQFLTVVGLKK